DAIFFEGKAEKPVYLLITDGEAELKDAGHLWGKNTAETDEQIKADNNDKTIRVACIGPAGEKLSRLACIINDWGRAAARSGLGAVMGSKNLKAVACKGSFKPNIFNPEKVKEFMSQVAEAIKTKPPPPFLELSRYGTCGSVVRHGFEHETPIKNWSGNNIEDFPIEKFERIDGDSVKKYITAKYVCHGCPIGCGGWLKVESGRYALEKAHKPEYESIAAFGPMCLNDDIESIIYANHLCNMYGLDTISAGATIAFAMECFEKGILTQRDTEGITLDWGNTEAIIEVLKKICEREGIGDVLADGVKMAAARIGRGAEKFAIHVCGQELPYHDPRNMPGWGIAYVCDPTPGRHTRGVNTAPIIKEERNLLGKGKIHAVGIARNHILSTSGLCFFGAFLRIPLREVLEAVTGWNLNDEELVRTGHRIAVIMHAFNLREGLKPSDFTMPSRAAGDPPLKVGKLKDVTLDFETPKKEYYEAMGLNTETGRISTERIKELELDEISDLFMD
ncbi:MAG: aldehyde ferredoxin oxidoreductase C-terminal domain-containing protein, partial [Candidatus Bathyarchaeia archaeon]